jgi:hypothetical protein
MFRMFDLIAATVALALLLPAVALAQGVSAPVFRGVMGMGKRQVALFELPGVSGNWQGETGQSIPGTNWKIMRVVLSPGATYLWVPGQKFQVVLKQGETFTAAGKVERAPDVERPANATAGEYLPPTPTQQALQRHIYEVQRQNAAYAAQRGQQPKPQPPPVAANPNLVRTVDCSAQAPAIESFGQAPYDTIVMVTSPG